LVIDNQYFCKIVKEHSRDVIDNSESIYALNLVELLVYYREYELLKIFIDNCIEKICSKITNTFLREDDNATKSLIHVTECFLNPIFKKYFDKNNMRATIANICLNAPLYYKEICFNIYCRLCIHDEGIAKRSMCTLIVFRYLIPKIISKKNNKYLLKELTELHKDMNSKYDEEPWVKRIIENLMLGVGPTFVSFKDELKKDFKYELKKEKINKMVLVLASYISKKDALKNSKYPSMKISRSLTDRTMLHKSTSNLTNAIKKNKVNLQAVEENPRENPRENPQENTNSDETLSPKNKMIKTLAKLFEKNKKWFERVCHNTWQRYK